MWKQKEENKITICRFALKSWHSDRNLGTSDGYHHRWLLFGALIHSHVGLENLHKVWTKSGPVQSLAEAYVVLLLVQTSVGHNHNNKNNPEISLYLFIIESLFTSANPSFWRKHETPAFTGSKNGDPQHFYHIFPYFSTGLIPTSPSHGSASSAWIRTSGSSTTPWAQWQVTQGPKLKVVALASKISIWEDGIWMGYPGYQCSYCSYNMIHIFLDYIYISYIHIFI